MIDCDVHNALSRRAVLKQYMASRWHGYFDQGVVTGASTGGLQVGIKWMPDSVYRNDSRPADGGTPGSSLALMREQLLDRYGVEKAILHPVSDYTGIPVDGPMGGAGMAALNDWMVAEWLEQDERLYAAISVPIEDSARAAAEVRRAAAASSRFVKVMLPAVTRAPLGHPNYWPIYEAAAEVGLPLAVHVSGGSTALGYPSFYAEQGTAQPQTLQMQVISLASCGVFEQFPQLQVAIEEAALGWMGPLMWRLDRTWESMRQQMPHMERRPSEVVREHFWLTTQPLDEPETAQQLVEMLADLDMDDRILFASDYPHWNFDSPERVLPPSVIGDELRAKILAGNALDLFAFA